MELISLGNLDDVEQQVLYSLFVLEAIPKKKRINLKAFFDLTGGGVNSCQQRFLVGNKFREWYVAPYALEGQGVAESMRMSPQDVINHDGNYKSVLYEWGWLDIPKTSLLAIVLTRSTNSVAHLLPKNVQNLVSAPNILDPSLAEIKNYLFLHQTDAVTLRGHQAVINNCQILDSWVMTLQNRFSLPKYLPITLGFGRSPSLSWQRCGGEAFPPFTHTG